MTETTSITVADGKYTVQHENGANLRALRYGEPWARDLVGDNLVYWMACRIAELEIRVDELDHCLTDSATYIDILGGNSGRIHRTLKSP